MKRVIRKGVFESNSSSCHAICVAKKKPERYPKFIHFRFGEFGWEEEPYNNPADYLYTLIYYLYDEDKKKLSECLNHIVDVCATVGVKCEFDEPMYDAGKYFDSGYIDHGCNAKEFLDAVMHNDNRLLRFLFGDSNVITGNDNNEWFGEYMCYFDKEPYEIYYKYN